MKKALIISILALVLPLVPAASAPYYYDVGDQVFAISAGPTTPLLYYNGNNDSLTIGPGFGEAGKISLGGLGSLSYQVFVTHQLAIGGELGYQFNFAPNWNVLTSVPIAVKLTYYPIQGKFELPISLSLGANYIAFEDHSRITMSVSAMIGFNYFITDEWGIGISAGLSLLPEFYFEAPEKNSIQLDVPTTISAIYRH